MTAMERLRLVDRGNRDPHLLAARGAGRLAEQAGDGLDDNIYDPDTDPDAYALFRLGWQDSRQENS